MAQTVKNPPTVQETWVRSLGRKHPLENGYPSMTYYRAQGTLLNVVWQPRWKGNWGRMDTCACMAESLCGALETITALLIGYTLIFNIK